MKKGLALLLAVLSLLCLTACGGESSGAAGISAYIETSAGKLELGAAFDSAAFGDPNEVVSAVSCHYDGEDSIYYYDGLVVYTYMMENSSIVYSIELSDDTRQTPEGAKVGMSEQAVTELYGEPDETLPTGIKYAISETAELIFRIKDGTVSVIEYYEE